MLAVPERNEPTSAPTPVQTGQSDGPKPRPPGEPGVPIRWPGTALQRKLTVALGIVVAALVALAAMGYAGLHRSAGAAQQLFEEDFGAIYDLACLRANLNAERHDAGLLSAMPGSAWAEWERGLRERAADNHAILQRLAVHRRRVTVAEPDLDELRTLAETFARTRDTEVLPHLAAGQLIEAKALITDVQQERLLRLKALARSLERNHVAAATALAAAAQRVLYVRDNGAVKQLGLYWLLLNQSPPPHESVP